MKSLLRRQTNNVNNNNNNHQQNNSFKRYLSLKNLISLSISGTIGSGIFVLTGIASNQYSGQFIPVSYILAALPCFLSALCYAEFSARINTSTGSGYSFVYYSLGEFFAFIIGWCNLIATIAALSATSLTWSNYFDSLFNNSIKNFTLNTLNAHWNSVEPFNNYIDFPAIIILTILFSISLIGIEFTALFNDILSIVNIFVLVSLTIFGFIYGSKENLSAIPYKNGLHGIIKGSSIVLYAYIGFETSTFAITEAKNPSKHVPLSMFTSLSLICVMYSLLSLSLNFMQNYTKIDTNAPFPTAFANVRYVHVIASIGPVLSLTGTLFTSIYGLGRIIYAMANDGLIFRFLSRLHKKSKIPHIATCVGFIMSILLVIVFDIKDLIGFADICGFLSYSMVSTALLVLRYTDENIEKINSNEIHKDFQETSFSTRPTLHLEEISEPLLSEFNDPFDDDYNESVQQIQTSVSTAKNKLTTKNKCAARFSKQFQKKFSINVILFTFMLNVIISCLFNYIEKFDVLIIITIVLINIVASILLVLFCEQAETTESEIAFKVPLVPFIPIISMGLNIFLMMSSPSKDWLIFFSIVILGLPIYFFYGIQNSNLK